MADTSFSNQQIEDIISEPGIDFREYDEIYDLEILQENPININSSDIFTLQKVPGLDLNIAQIIIRFREKYGHYFSPNELYSIKEIPPNTIKCILPFLTASDIKHKERNNLLTVPSALKINWRTRTSYSFHDINDSLYNKYAGSKIKSYNRFSFNYDNAEFGFITEKDAGERSYLDYWTTHLMIKNTGPFDIIILGDYRYDSGLGLILGEPYGYFKTIDAAYPVKKKERLIQPNNSSNEEDFYRGAAGSFRYNDFQFSGFYSNQFRDAIADSTSQYISSLSYTGYHRTSTEIKDKNLVHEIKWGIRSEYLFNKFFSASLLFCHSYFNKIFSNDIPYSPYGNSFNDLSISYNFQNSSMIYMNGEFAYDFNSVASINSLQIPINKDFLFICSVRNYPRNFISLSGHSLAETSGKVQNEIGFYNGFKLKTDYGTLNVYYDQFKFPFGGYRFPISNSGEELLIGYINSLTDNIDIKFNYKYENKDYIINEAEQKYVYRRLRNDLRFILRWNLWGTIDEKTIAEYNSVTIQQNHLNEQGVLLSNSISLHFSNYLDFAFSISLFKTRSYYSSVYEYDEYINGLITGRVLYGEGLKLNIYLKYQLFHNVNLSVQYSETFKPKEILINPFYSIITNNFIFQLEAGIN